MADDPKEDSAAAQLRKLQRAEDGKKAMAEYEAEAAAVRAKTEKLRALRLARDAANPVAATPARKPKAAGKQPKRDSGSLADWLKQRDDGGHRN